MPLGDVVPKIGGVVPLQKAGIVAKLGVIDAETVTVTVAVPVHPTEVPVTV